MVVATVALVAAVGGTTYAQTAINGADIRAKSIAGAKLKNQAVGTAQLRDLAVQSRDIQSGAVTVSKLRRGAVTGPKIAAGAVGAAAIGQGSVSRADLQASARVPSVTVRTSAIQGVLPGGLGDAQVSCNAGETLISGGAGVISAPAPGIEILANRPEAGGARWQGIVFNGSAGTIQFVSHAVCATTS
jgi:hypothetical protein